MSVLLPGQAAAPDGPCDLTMMYVLHHGFRRDLRDFLAAAEATPLTDRRCWSALDERWQLFAELLHDHHTKEDEVVWPLLRERAATVGDLAAVRVLDDMEAEHEQIDPLLEQAGSLLATMATAPSGAVNDELVTVLRRSSLVLDAHLSHEERDAISVLQRLVPGEVWAEVERSKLRGGVSRKTLTVMLPWAVEALPPAFVSTMLVEAGLPFRVILRVGRPRFHRLQRAAFTHAAAGAVA